jgi:hypothetical protein
VNDPSTWTRPWTFAMPLTRNASEAVLEYACHEGNMAMANLLAAARAEERATATGRTRETRGRGVEGLPDVPNPPAIGLSGAWQVAGERQPNFAGYSTASRLIITDAGDTVTVQSNTGTEGQMQTTVYRLDGQEVGVPGPVGWHTTARASRSDGRLVVSVTRTIDGPDGKLTFAITDTYSERAGALTLERRQGPRVQTTVYTRP